MTTTVARGLSPVRELLPNGAVAVAQESPATPAVTINATMHTGSFAEPPNLPGLAFFASRVIDRGTERSSAAEIAEALDDRGVTLNITTTRHAISVACTSLADDFDAMLDLVSDVICRPVFPDDQIELRRAEIVTQLRQDQDNPAVRAVESMFSLLYGDPHPYGRPPKGTIASVDCIDRPALVGFHERHFVPASLVVCIVGAVGPEQALARAGRAFGSWRSGVSPAAAPREDGLFAGPSPRRVSVTSMMSKSQADIAYGFVTIRRIDPAYYAWWVMNTILGQYGLGGRLGENIRERQGMAYYAYSAFDPHVIPGPLMVRAGVDGANVARTITAIDQEIAAFATQGPTDEELEDTKRYLIGSLPRMLETNAGIASFLQASERFGLGLDHDRRLPGLVSAVTLDATRAAAAQLSPDNAAVAIAGPYQP
jgi:zinc protease